MTREEQETTITFDRASDEATIYTADPVMMRKIDKLLDSGASVAVVREDAFSRTYRCPSKWVKMVPPRQYSKEQREKMSQRAKENLGKWRDVSA